MYFGTRLMIGTLVVAVSGGGAAQAADKAAMIADALSAAPASVAKGATVMIPDATGGMETAQTGIHKAPQ